MLSTAKKRNSYCSPTAKISKYRGFFVHKIFFACSKRANKSSFYRLGLCLVLLRLKKRCRSRHRTHALSAPLFVPYAPYVQLLTKHKSKRESNNFVRSEGYSADNKSRKKNQVKQILKPTLKSCNPHTKKELRKPRRSHTPRHAERNIGSRSGPVAQHNRATECSPPKIRSPHPSQIKQCLQGHPTMQRHCRREKPAMGNPSRQSTKKGCDLHRSHPTIP